MKSTSLFNPTSVAACRPPTDSAATASIGGIPYRMAFAGGWIDQPFVSRLNPSPPGSMVVVQIKPVNPFMDRAGMATGTRKAAQQLWGNQIPGGGDRMALVRELYRAENDHQPKPSGSQDMIGLIYPGVNRLDFDASHDEGYFPKQIESCNDPQVMRWIESVVKMIAIAPRPEGYSPLGEQNLDAGAIQRLGQTGKDCYDAIVRRDASALGQSMNDCMKCWETILPNTVRHPLVKTDLPGILKYYQDRYPGAMYSGCGGGYLYVVSEKPVPGAFGIEVRGDRDE
jgi:hypothetical protein